MTMKNGTGSQARPKGRPSAPLTLAVDIGGAGIKSIVLDTNGKAVTKRLRTATPKRAKPAEVVSIVSKLAKRQGKFDRVSVGFPGVVKDGVTYTAANLGKGWHGFELEAALAKKLKKPVRVANDADVQGLGAVSGRGVELVITLGTGFGSVLFANGTRIHLELGHHPFHRGKTYEEELGRAALDDKGKKKWNRLLREAIDDLKRTFNYDRLYIGGGNARHVRFELPESVFLISNEDGLLGGIALWREQREPDMAAIAERASQNPTQPASPPLRAGSARGADDGAMRSGKEAADGPGRSSSGKDSARARPN